MKKYLLNKLMYNESRDSNLFCFVQRPVDVYDRKISAPAKLPHYHLPVTEDGKRIPSRSRSNYMQQLYGRRSRSLSRFRFNKKQKWNRLKEYKKFGLNT